MKKLLLILLLFSPFIGKSQARQIEFNSIDSLYAMKNDTLYVINFWATWCKPCVEELPAFENVTSQRKLPVRVFLVSMDPPKMLDSRVNKFISAWHIKSTVWLLDVANATEWIDRVSPTWSGAIPATIFVRNGKKEFVEKKMTADELAEKINTHLK